MRRKMKEPNPDEKDNVTQCQICNQSFNGKGATVHTRDTGHNKWRILLPKPDESGLPHSNQQQVDLFMKENKINSVECQADAFGESEGLDHDR